MKGDFLTTAFNHLRSRLRQADVVDDDSDDALQDAFCRLWTRKETIKGEHEAEGILAVTARNIRIDRYRMQAVHPVVGLESVAEPSCMAEDGNDTMEIYRRVKRLVEESLSPRDREILFKRERDGWDFDELADYFNLSEANVRMILSRARKTIRNLYRQQNNI